MSKIFADVVLPLSLPKLYSYNVPEKLQNQLQTGMRVIVQFGKKKFYTAIVFRIHNEKPQEYETKEIISVLDEKPIINDYQIKLWKWIAEYYICSLGDVYKAAVPAGLKIESKTYITLSVNPDLTKIENSDEQIVVSALENTPYLKIEEINKIVKEHNPIKIIHTLATKKIIIITERLSDNYKPKTEKYIWLNPNLDSDKKIKEVFDRIEKYPKQLAVLMNYISLSKTTLPPVDNTDISVKLSTLLKKSNVSRSVVDSLVKKQIFILQDKTVDRITGSNSVNSEKKQLSVVQKKALEEIKKNFETKDTVLLHGVTSSGKTEIYIHLIEETLKKGKQVLYLLPEIALTTQIISRLEAVFGERTGIYHSKFNDNERVEIWNKVLFESEKKYSIILGARSALFLPFDNLGLIIVDEEHENTFKQFDPAPRYNARDTALVLARIHGCKTLLGTATPSVETYFNAYTGKYGLVELTQRHSNIKLPQIIIADTKEARRKKQMKSIFTPVLIEHIERALKNNEQVILFQNRRGFAPFIECQTCGWVPYCKNCDVSLTYHRHTNTLVCHYCGYTVTNPTSCQACGDTALKTVGIGTEKIENEIQIFFPDAKIRRMDLDSTRSKKAYSEIIDSFQRKETDILVGTQMISKGLDFDNVSVVGIINADNMLNYPDFRAYERSFQLMSQVSGRAGRKNKQGTVIIQTANPKHHIIKYVVNNDYKKMFFSQIKERQEFSYPPYYRLIKLTVKHKNKEKVDKFAADLATYLRAVFKDRVLGPEYPPIARVQNFYKKDIIIKIEKNKFNKKTRNIIRYAIEYIKAGLSYSNINVLTDVDPM